MSAPKPATALPWNMQDGGRSNLAHVEAEKDGAQVCSINKARVADAAYIVAACNAYPKLIEDRRRLVEALRDRLLYATDVEYRVVADAKAAEATAGNVTHEEAQNERDADLLAELGEAD